MDRLKTFLIYALCIAGLIVFSEFLINVGLNSAYKPISRKDGIEQVKIYQAEATLVNGRIRGLITNSEAIDVSGKYIRLELFSKRGVSLGSKYIEIGNLGKNENKAFDAYFKLKEVSSYKISISDKKGEEHEEELKLLPENLTMPQVILGTAITLLIFW